MKAQKFVIHNNKRYHLHGNYYYADFYTKGKSVKKTLHRTIWEEVNNRKIPQDYCVHHIDGNPHNNNPENLEVMDRGKHQSYHMLEKLKDLEYKRRLIEQLYKASHKAAEWHKSEEGRKWHSKNSIALWKNKKRIKVNCVQCSEEYETVFPTRSRFCSSRCNQNYRYKKKVYHEDRECVICGNEFSVKKSEKTKSCSRSCAAAIAWGLDRKRTTAQLLINTLTS